MTGERGSDGIGRRRDEIPASAPPERSAAWHGGQPDHRADGRRPSESGARPSPPAWTPDAMIDHLGGDEFLARQLVALFIAEYPKLLAALRDRIAAGDPEQIRRAAHALKGCVANFAANGARTTAFEIESMGASGRLGGVAGKLTQLEREIASMVADMRDFEARSRCES